MAAVEAAVAHCLRNGDGFLKLGGLWLESRVAHSNLSSLLTGFLVQHEALAPQVAHVKTGRRQDRGMFATEAVAKQLAQLIPPERLWRETHDVLDVASEAASGSEAEEMQPRPDIGAQLSALLGHAVDFRLRTTPAGEVSLIDITMIFTGLDNNCASEAIRNVTLVWPDVQAKTRTYKFPGRGQRSTPVAPLATALEFSFLLPGRAAARTRRQAAVLMVRYIGGDCALVGEVYANRRAQAALAATPEEQRTPQQQAARLCGEAVEAQTQTAVAEAAMFIPCKPLVIQDDESVGLPGGDHLYAAARQGENLIKIGVSKDVLQRVGQLAQQFGGQSGPTRPCWKAWCSNS